MRALVLAVFVTLVTFGAVAQAPTSQGISADTLKWGPAPSVLPKGGEMSGLFGDPEKPGTFTVRLKMPAGYKIAPHKHPHSELVTVISGELHFGSGDKMDEVGAQKLGPGGFVYLPANESHYAFARLETVIQITTEGPFGINYVNPTDDPSKR